MFLLGIVIGIFTLGLGLILVWVGSIIWAVVAAGNANKKMVSNAGLHINTTFGGQQQPIQSAPQNYQQTQQPLVQESKLYPPISEEPKQEYKSAATPPTSTQQSFDLGQWFEKNKKSVLIGAGGIIGLLILFVAIKYVFSINFSKKDNNTNATIQQSQNNSSTTTQATDNSFKETPAPTTYVQREIPKPLVPIVKAANVLPQWTSNEEIDGDYILIGLYVGALGQKPMKLFIVGVDTITKHVVGYSSVNGNRVDFEGTFTVRLRKASTNQASNIIDFNTYIYNLVLFEPDGINTNGIFQLQIDVTDAQGSSGSGSWTSYNRKLYREVSLSDTYLAQEQ